MAAFTRSAGIFILYLTSCANDFARENKRTTVSTADILAAVRELDFDVFTEKLEDFLAKLRAAETSKKASTVTKKGASKVVNDEEAGDGDVDVDGDGDGDGEGGASADVDAEVAATQGAN